MSFCGGGGVGCTVIFVSNPTAVLRLRLCCVVVGVVTMKTIKTMRFVMNLQKKARARPG